MCHYMNYEEKALQLMGYTINDCRDVDLYWAVFNHRKMWVYIAKTYAQYLDKEDICIKDIPSVVRLKEDYIAFGVSGRYDVHNNCFLCDYVENTIGYAYCRSCPLIWGKNINEICGRSIYGAMNVEIGMLSVVKDKRKTLKKIVKLAYKIADLPERSNNRIDFIKHVTTEQEWDDTMKDESREMTKCITTT